LKHLKLQIFILYGAGPVELQQFGERQVFDQNRSISSELARALKERLQVTSGDDTLSVLLPEGSMEKTVFVCFDRPGFSGVFHGLGQIVVIDDCAGWGCAWGLLRFFLAQIARDVAERGASIVLRSSAASWKQRRKQENERQQTRDGESGTHGIAPCARRGNGVVGRASGAAGHTQSLGEMERKRSY
jgi:hypothetical protein